MAHPMSEKSTLRASMSSHLMLMASLLNGNRRFQVPGFAVAATDC
jgi:hypothetical protein